MGDFSKEKEPRACRYEDGEHSQGQEPFRQIRGEVESAGCEEDAGEKGNAQDLPIEPVVIKPESAPILKPDPDPLDLRLELLAAALALPYKDRPALRPNFFPELPVGAAAVPIAAIGAIRGREGSFSFRLL